MSPIKTEIKITVIKIKEGSVYKIDLKHEGLDMLTSKIEVISFQLRLVVRISL